MEEDQKNKCSRCNKDIFFGTLMVRNNYIYKLYKNGSYHYYCGWNCFSAERREYEKSKEEARNGVS